MKKKNNDLILNIPDNRADIVFLHCNFIKHVRPAHKTYIKEFRIDYERDRR